MKYSPEILHPTAPNDRIRIENLTKDSSTSVHDEIESQIKDLTECQNPEIRYKDHPELLKTHVGNYINGRSTFDIGVWVYYPWNRVLAHLLNEDEFVIVRTNRNKYKITQEEQDTLANKTIGVVGLSVGQSVAVTLVQERVCGEIRLADFDTLELSNLNRVRTPVYNIGVNKAVAAAREIAEIDPFVKVVVYDQGLTEENMDSFFTNGGKIDLLVEECDGLDIKIQARLKARELRIPVLMETNDRCMVDIERFDLEPNRKILHGLVEGLDVDKLKLLKTNEEKAPVVLKLLGIKKTSTKLRASMMEIEETLVTWPQLGSAVTFGAGVLVEYIRGVLLNKLIDSGRHYNEITNLDSPRYDRVLNEKVDKFDYRYAQEFQCQINGVDQLDSKTINNIMDYVLDAPSAANNQPWYWVYKAGVLMLFHVEERSKSFWDPLHFAPAVGFGCAIRNLQIVARHFGYGVNEHFQLHHFGNNKEPVAYFTFSSTDVQSHELFKFLKNRHTNRSNQISEPIPQNALEDLRTVGSNIFHVFHVTDNEEKNKVAALSGKMEQIRLLNPCGHSNFVDEIRWNKNEVEEKRDGIDLDTVDLTASERIGLEISKDHNVMGFLRDENLGSGFQEIVAKGLRNCAAISIIAIEKDTIEDILQCGKMYEEYWLRCAQNDISIHPLTSSAILPYNLNHSKEFSSKITKQEANQIEQIENHLKELIGIPINWTIFMVSKLGAITEPSIKSLRLDKTHTFSVSEK